MLFSFGFFIRSLLTGRGGSTVKNLEQGKEDTSLTNTSPYTSFDGLDVGNCA